MVKAALAVAETPALETTPEDNTVTQPGLPQQAAQADQARGGEIPAVPVEDLGGVPKPESAATPEPAAPRPVPAEAEVPVAASDAAAMLDHVEEAADEPMPDASDVAAILAPPAPASASPAAQEAPEGTQAFQAEAPPAPAEPEGQPVTAADESAELLPDAGASPASVDGAGGEAGPSAAPDAGATMASREGEHGGSESGTRSSP